MIEILKKIRAGMMLSQEEVGQAVTAMMDGEATPSQIGAFLMGLAQRGETIDELVGAARVLRQRALTIKATTVAIDCCGTGGDHSGTLNISTAVALVVAACGAPVAKHGNRAASSKSGAADVLEALGINLDMSVARSEDALEKFNFCFLMAPNHHKALKPLAPIRKELGVRTIFNLMGPLSNPGGTKRQLVGVFDKKWVTPMAHVLNQLGTEKAWVVHGSDGLDEVTLTGETYCSVLEDGKVTDRVLRPDDFGLPAIRAKDIHGGDASENAVALKALLHGTPSAYRNIVLANAAVALIIAGKVSDLKEGVAMAATAIDEGKALQLLNNYVAFSREAA
jgi:anthranilate phosphoribosyltransferase